MPQFVSTQIGKGTVLQAPTADGTVGQFLKTDGAGNLSFDTVAASPAGSDTQVQFNDGGAFGASANLTWDDATFQVTGTSTTAPTLVAKLPASATANALEVQDSTSAVKAGCDQDGHLYTDHGTDCLTLGKNLGTSWQDNETCIGHSAATGGNAVSVGHSATTGSNAVSIGSGASTSNNGVSIGHSVTGAQNAIVIGQGAATSGTHTVSDASIAIGRGVTSTVGACVIGTDRANGLTDFVFGGSGVANNAFDITMHPAGANGTDVAGKNYTLHAGQGTGTGTGGHLIFQTAAPGTTGSSLNTLATALEIDDSQAVTVSNAYTLPTADGTVGQFIKTDGAGNLSFDTVAASPSGADTQIQFNDGGSFGGSANLTWDDATLQVTGTNTASPVLIAKMPASHADNAFEVQDSTGTVKSFINKDGDAQFTELGVGGASQLSGYAVNMSGVFKTVGEMRLANGFGFNRPTDNASITPVEYTPVGGGATPNNLWINTNRGLVNNNTATYGQGGSIYLNCGAGGYGSTGDVDGGDAGRVVVRCKPGGTGIGTGIAGAEGGFEIVDDSLATLFAVLNDATIGFFGATPVAQQSTTGTTTGFTAGSGTSANDDSTYTGNTGSTAYTVGDIVLALKNLGLIAA